MWPFKCAHPARALIVKTDSTEARIDDDFTEVTYNLLCAKCRKQVTISYAKMHGGLDAFLKRELKIEEHEK